MKKKPFDFWKDLEKGWLPNTITMIGLVLLIPTIYYIEKSILGWGLTFYVAAWICDFFDGWTARRYKATSQIGAFFDPLADKIFAIIFLIYYWNDISVWISVPIIAIAAALTGIRIYKMNYGKKKKIPYNIMARGAGKIKTNVERAAFCVIILATYYVSQGLMPKAILDPAVIIANVLLIVSIIFAGFSLNHQIQEIS